MTPCPKKGQQKISSEMTSTKDQGQLTEEPEIRKRKSKWMKSRAPKTMTRAENNRRHVSPRRGNKVTRRKKHERFDLEQKNDDGAPTWTRCAQGWWKLPTTWSTERKQKESAQESLKTTLNNEASVRKTKNITKHGKKKQWETTDWSRVLTHNVNKEEKWDKRNGDNDRQPDGLTVSAPTNQISNFRKQSTENAAVEIKANDQGANRRAVELKENHWQLNNVWELFSQISLEFWVNCTSEHYTRYRK